jgi:hypothetical protein
VPETLQSTALAKSAAEILGIFKLKVVFLTKVAGAGLVISETLVLCFLHAKRRNIKAMNSNFFINVFKSIP